MTERHAIPISGKDSLATAIIQMERQPDLQYELFFNQTDAELPETLTWIDKLESYFQQPIIRIGDNLEDIIQNHGILPSQMVRFCTREAKIEPMERYFAGHTTYVYYGLRADEPLRTGYARKAKNDQEARGLYS